MERRRRVYDFADALADATSRYGTRLTLLLGNGFSIDYDHAAFDYSALADRAELPGLHRPRRAVFDAVGSPDFEAVIDALGIASRLVDVYQVGGEWAAVWAEDAEVVRNGLAEALAAGHPDSAKGLGKDEVEHARAFLRNFEAFYTLSYDLLIYWVLVRSRTKPDVGMDDGFRATRTGAAPGWAPGRPQNLFFLHGALHLFEEDGETVKLSNAKDGRLVDALRARIKSGEYPVVVTEGSRAQKEARIRASAYLSDAHARLAEVQGALFVHGVDFSSNDRHVFDAVAAHRGVETIYVSLHAPGRSGALSARALDLIDRVEAIQEARRSAGGPTLRTRFYDASTAHVWRG